MAIDETDEDRLDGAMAHIDARFDVIEAKLGSRKFEIAVIAMASLSALTGICLATYVYVLKPLFGLS